MTDLTERRCPGLPASWINGWLAAIGITQLLPDVSLRWSDDPEPVAVIRHPSGLDIDSAIHEALVALDPDSWPIARHLDGHLELSLNPTVEAFVARAELSRASEALGWMLSSLYTEVLDRKDGLQIEKSAFNVAVPRGETPHERLTKLQETIPQMDVAASLKGTGERIKANGMGFDPTRFGSAADKVDKYAEPIIETLGFLGMRSFVCTGFRGEVRQLGWGRRRLAVGSFRWPAWGDYLNCEAIDAFLDLWYLDRTWAGHHCVATYQLVPYLPQNPSDPTRGFGSERT